LSNDDGAGTDDENFLNGSVFGHNRACRV
jgi:hypothetical protein